MKTICVFGASSASLDQTYYDSAYELGQILAQSGYDLVYGAGNLGIMGAVARGVKQDQGKIIGVIPSFLNMEGVAYPHCDELIVTETMRERKAEMESRADGFVALPGGYGTFEELLEVLTLKQLSRHNKPIVIVNTNGYYDALLSQMEATIEQNFAKPSCRELYAVCKNAEETVSYLKNYVPKEIELKVFCYVDKGKA